MPSISSHLPSDSPIIRVTGLTKEFGSLRAVDGLSFTVNQADVYGFLGQNGAGKSTTIRMLLTLITPTAGRIEIFGLDLSTHRKEILRRVGAVIERPDLYKYLSAYENLSIFARMSGVRPTRKLLMDQLEQVGLAQRAHSKAGTFSQGMKQRLGIAVALAHDPDLVILDEPTNGLDPQGIADIRNLILHLSNHRKKTLLVSSHLLSEMELIAGSMLIIDKGRKVIEGRVTELFDPALTLVEIDSTDPDQTAAVIGRSAWKKYLYEHSTGARHPDSAGSSASGTTRGNNRSVLLRMDRGLVPALAADLVREGVQIQAIRPRHSLEEYFLSLTTANQHVETFAD